MVSKLLVARLSLKSSGLLVHKFAAYGVLQGNENLLMTDIIDRRTVKEQKERKYVNLGFLSRQFKRGHVWAMM